MIDNSQIKKLLSLPDEELRKKVSDAAIAAGADKYMTAKALSDIGSLRMMIDSLDGQQMTELIKRVNPSALDEITKRINEIK